MGKKGKQGASRPSEEIVSGSRGVALLDDKEDQKTLLVSVMDESDKESGQKEFVPSRGLSTFEANELLLQYGRNELADVSTPKVGCYPASVAPCPWDLSLRLPFACLLACLLACSPQSPFLLLL